MLEAEKIVQDYAANNACFTCSFQSEDMVVLDLIRQVNPSIPVLFLETGYHFREVYEYRDRMADEWNLNLVNCMPQLPLAEQESQFGLLYQVDPNRCCAIRKVEPLKRYLSGYRTWFTGLRREQSPTRANLQPVSQQDHLTKVSPLYDWTMRDVEAYCVTRGIPRLSLYDQGYTSIGCQPCTILPVDPTDARSGRWAGSGKIECGLHVK